MYKPMILISDLPIRSDWWEELQRRVTVFSHHLKLHSISTELKIGACSWFIKIWWLECRYLTSGYISWGQIQQHSNCYRSNWTISFPNLKPRIWSGVYNFSVVRVALSIPSRVFPRQVPWNYQTESVLSQTRSHLPTKSNNRNLKRSVVDINSTFKVRIHSRLGNLTRFGPFYQPNLRHSCWIRKSGCGCPIVVNWYITLISTT